LSYPDTHHVSQGKKKDVGHFKIQNACACVGISFSEMLHGFFCFVRVHADTLKKFTQVFMCMEMPYEQGI
jgi:hypothetical protein